MVVKVIKEDGVLHEESFYSCDHARSFRRTDRLDIELHYVPSRKPHVISLPRDGDVAYIEENGRTVSVKRWEGNGGNGEDGAETGNDLTNRPVTFRG